MGNDKVLELAKANSSLKIQQILKSGNIKMTFRTTFVHRNGQLRFKYDKKYEPKSI